MPRHSLRRDEAGTAMVESAIMFPVAFFLMLAVLEIGNLFAQMVLAEKATEMGVRFAVTSDIAATGVPDCGVDTTATMGTPCRLVAGSDTWIRTCTSSSGDCSAAAFDAIVQRMQSVYGRITPANVVVEYSGSGLGFVGRGSPVPNVSVRLTGLTFDYVVLSALARGWFGATADDSLTLPEFRATMTGEDLQS